MVDNLGVEVVCLHLTALVDFELDFDITKEHA